VGTPPVAPESCPSPQTAFNPAVEACPDQLPEWLRRGTRAASERPEGDPEGHPAAARVSSSSKPLALQGAEDGREGAPRPPRPGSRRTRSSAPARTCSAPRPPRCAPKANAGPQSWLHAVDERPHVRPPRRGARPGSARCTSPKADDRCRPPGQEQAASRGRLLRGRRPAAARPPCCAATTRQAAVTRPRAGVAGTVLVALPRGAELGLQELLSASCSMLGASSRKRASRAEKNTALAASRAAPITRSLRGTSGLAASSSPCGPEGASSAPCGPELILSSGGRAGLRRSALSPRPTTGTLSAPAGSCRRAEG